MAENGFLNVAMAHLQGDECDEIVLLGTEYGYHEPDYDSYIDIGHAFVNDMGTGFLQTEGTEDDWENVGLTILRKFWLERRRSFPLSYPHCCG